MSFLALSARAPDDTPLLALCSSASFQLGLGAFLSTIPFQNARCRTAFPGNACPTVQDLGQVCSFQDKNCGGFDSPVILMKKSLSVGYSFAQSASGAIRAFSQSCYCRPFHQNGGRTSMIRDSLMRGYSPKAFEQYLHRSSRLKTPARRRWSSFTMSVIFLPHQKPCWSTRSR